MFHFFTILILIRRYSTLARNTGEFILKIYYLGNLKIPCKKSSKVWKVSYNTSKFSLTDKLIISLHHNPSHSLRMQKSGCTRRENLKFSGVFFKTFFFLLWLKTTFEHFPFSPFENALCFHPFNFQRWKPQLSFLSHHSTSTHLDAIFDKNISSKKYACFFFFCEIEKLEKKNIYWSVIFVKIFLWIFLRW